MLTKMEEILAKSRWLAGGEYSLADVNTYPMVEGVTRLYREFWTDKNVPRCMEWMAHINDRPAVKQAFCAVALPQLAGQCARRREDRAGSRLSTVGVAKIAKYFSSVGRIRTDINDQISLDRLK